MLPKRQKKPLKLKLSLKFLFLFTLLFGIMLLLTTLIILYYPARNQPSTYLLFTISLIVVNVIITILVGWIITVILLNPVDQINDTLESLDKGVLTQQLSISSGDEFEDIAAKINRLIATLHEVFTKSNSERKQLFIENNRAETVLSTIGDGVIAVDINRNITLFNHAAEKITGLSISQTAGKPINQIMKIFDKKDEISPLTYCPISSETNGVSFSKDNLTLVSPVKESYINFSSVQIRQEENNNLGCIMTIHDITHDKQLEEMKLDFVSMAAHELRTPLTSIKGYLSVFIDENKENFKGDQMMFLERIMNSTETLLSLVENILNVSRVERGTLSVNRQPIDWLPLVEQCATNLSNRAKEKNIELTYIPLNGIKINVDADKLRITEVLNNLIANAINYTPTGGKITVWTQIDGQMIVTHVKDTGIGIPQEAMGRLFSKFYRVNNKLEMVKGTGLGLYISKAIIELHKGKIWVDSSPGRGSTFSFSLPILDQGDVKLPS